MKKKIIFSLVVLFIVFAFLYKAYVASEKNNSKKFYKELIVDR